MQTNHLNCFFFLIIISSALSAQYASEIVEPDNIKTIVFKSNDISAQFPIVSKDEYIFLSFDDLNADEQDYYYKIKHYNYNWLPSQLFQSEIIEGFDNIRIDDYSNSFNTLQPYTHYELKLPNDQTKFLISGNYIIEIYNTADKMVFSRKFCVFENRTEIDVQIFKLQNMNFFNSHQTIHFSVNPSERNFREPDKRIFTTILQNYQWDSSIQNIKFQYQVNSSLIYKYDVETKFEGGNEFLFFDSKDLRITSPNISHINRSELYETYLNIDYDRSFNNYNYTQDINGDFEIRTVNGSQKASIEADYSWVYFSLAADYNLNGDSIYLYGKFNNYKFLDINKLYYNPSLELYEGVMLLKQGFYNYKYVLKTEKSINKTILNGSHAITENEYLVLVYYRDIGSNYDKLIGVGKANSFNLKN